VVHIERLTEKLVGQFQQVIFHRPKFSKRFLRAIEICNLRQVEVHADYDDLIFVPTLASSSPLYINGNRPLNKVEAYFSDNRDALSYFDSVIVSTRALASHIKSEFPVKFVTVLPNSLPRLFQEPSVADPPGTGAGGAGARVTGALNSEFTIGYFPGSNSHAHDVDMIRDALDNVFTAVPNCKLVVMGRMERGDLPLLADSIELKPFVDYNRYLDQLAQVDLSIAPLQNNIFNNAKSAVKLIESVAVGTPILASDNPDMRDHSNAMSAVVKDDAGWTDMLLKCVQGEAGFDCSEKEQLKGAYSVTSRLPILKDLIGFAA
jgi:glycosyltransferase involved in cell wall biosynthesis